ncbi:MAG: transcriptional regulator, partial [Ignavibacteria bacterium]|nr:transcriptional regulator [Ignavibacteria bacterium]
ATGQVTEQVTGQATGQVIQAFERVVLAIGGEAKRQEIQDILGLRHRETFLQNYLNPALKYGYIEMKYPKIPNHPNQKYRLTLSGMNLVKKIKNKMI